MVTSNSIKLPHPPHSRGLGFYKHKVYCSPVIQITFRTNFKTIVKYIVLKSLIYSSLRYFILTHYINSYYVTLSFNLTNQTLQVDSSGVNSTLGSGKDILLLSSQDPSPSSFIFRYFIFRQIKQTP